MADRLAAAGYTVLVPNVFHRHGPAPVVELPDFINPAERPEIIQSLRPAARTLTPEAAMRDAGVYLDWLADSPLTVDGPVGVTGYCMGAALALRTAGTHPDRVAAAAGFHGAYLATDAPDSPHLLAERITAELYFGHADQDSTNPAEQIDRLDKALTAARRPPSRRGLPRRPSRLHPGGHRDVRRRGDGTALGGPAGSAGPHPVTLTPGRRSPARQPEFVLRLDPPHVAGVVPAAHPRVHVQTVEPVEGVVVEFDAQARPGGDLDRPVAQLQGAGDDHVVGEVPRVVGVAGVVEIGDGRRHMGHRGEADAQV